MLVLNRKIDETIRIPEHDITVQILHIKGASVQVGLEAPLEVRILRGELKDEFGETPPNQQVIRVPRHQCHALRNQLNSLSIAAHLYRKEMEAGLQDDAEETFQKIVEQLHAIGNHHVLTTTKSLTTTSSSAKTALLVEDEPNEREMLAGFLNLEGFDVTTVSNGLEAIDYLASNEKPDTILMDMQMPECDGPTAIRRIRENASFDQVKIFAISGSTPEENDSIVDDVNGWFMKPLNPVSLLDNLRSTASSHSAENATI